MASNVVKERPIVGLPARKEALPPGPFAIILASVCRTHLLEVSISARYTLHRVLELDLYRVDRILAMVDLRKRAVCRTYVTRDIAEMRAFELEGKLQHVLHCIGVRVSVESCNL